MGKETKNLAYKTLLFAILLDSFQFTIHVPFFFLNIRLSCVSSRRIHRVPKVYKTHTHTLTNTIQCFHCCHAVGVVVPRRSSNTKRHELVMPVYIRIKKQERTIESNESKKYIYFLVTNQIFKLVPIRIRIRHLNRPCVCV